MLVEMEPEADAVAAGDPEAFASLVERYRPRLIAYAECCIRQDLRHGDRVQREDAEDLVQGMLLVVWRTWKSSGYQKNRPVFVWLRSCLGYEWLRQRQAARALKRKPSNGPVASLDQLSEAAGIEAVDDRRPETGVIEDDTNRVIREAVAQLKLPHQATMKAWLSGLRPGEVAARRGISRQAVHDSLTKSVQRLAVRIIPSLGGRAA